MRYVFNQTQLEFPRGKRDDRGRFRLAIEMVAGKKRAIHGRKGAEMSVFETILTPTIGAYRGRAAAAGHGIYATQKKYAQSQLSSPLNNLYEPCIGVWAYFQCITIQGQCTQPRPFQSPTWICRNRLFCRADISNCVSNAEYREVPWNINFNKNYFIYFYLIFYHISQSQSLKDV